MKQETCKACKGTGRQGIDNGLARFEWLCDVCNGLGAVLPDRQFRAHETRAERLPGRGAMGDSDQMSTPWTAISPSP